MLNEVDFDSVWFGHLNQAELIAREAGFPFWAEQRNIDMALPFIRIRYGNAMLSRYPILAARRLPFAGHHALETIFLGKKQGLVCTVDLSGAHRLRVLAVHLEHRLEARRLRAAYLIDEERLASTVPLIAAGDFNPPSSLSPGHSRRPGTNGTILAARPGGLSDFAHCLTGPGRNDLLVPQTGPGH